MRPGFLFRLACSAVTGCGELAERSTRIRAKMDFLKDFRLSLRQSACRALAISSGSGGEFLVLLRVLRAARALSGLLSGWGHPRDLRYIPSQ